MACRQVDAKPLLETVQEYCELDLKETNFSEIWININLFIHENAFENVVCEMAASLSRSQCLKSCLMPNDGSATWDI